jgi:hypothetical protein
MALKDDGSLSPVSVADGDRREYLRRVGCAADGPVTQAALPDGFPWFGAEPDRGATGVIVPDVWRWCFAVHVDGTPWLGDLVVPPEAVTLAQQQLAAFHHGA